MSIEERLKSTLAPRMTDSDRVTYFSSWLAAGPPQRWLNLIAATLSNYDGYVKAFKDHFFDPHEATTYRQKLEALALRQDKDVTRYAATFWAYASAALAEADEKTKWN